MSTRTYLAIEVGAIFEDRYEILSTLGEGGFGTVYKARQITTNQPVAIKVLHFGGHGKASEEKRIARFHREMQLCAQLHHPNIVRLIDTGQTAAGLVYTVFEFVPGKNLSEVLHGEGTLDPVEARHLMLQVLDALSCAHAQGMVHRDLKPSNIMIVTTGIRRNALVLDFGIGAIAEEARDEIYEPLTASNEAIGTPGYAAPEQLRGKASTPRADLYSWGLVFLECLTGKRVFTGESLPDLLYKQMSHAEVPIPAFLQAHPLGRLLRRVTAKDVASRDLGARELLQELEAYDLKKLRKDRQTEAAQANAAAQGGAAGRASSLEAEETITSEHLLSGRADLKPAPGGDAPAAAASEGPRQPANSAQGNDAQGRRLLGGERRQITAVCCHLTASSDDEDRIDPEDFDELLHAQQECCAEIARRFQGYVTSVLGDQVLLCFGYPLAREDDARRAARAALAIMAELRGEAEGLRAARKINLTLGIGIHTGLVVARDPGQHGRGDLNPIAGTTPRIATRLSTLASPDAIAVSGDSYRLLRSTFLFEEEGVHRVDGVSRPVEAFLLKGEKSAQDSSTTTLSNQDTALTGRDQELDLLLQHWARAQDGAGTGLLLTGEPGIGKSRLARELNRRIRAEAHAWLECRALPDSQNRALHPVIDMLERMLDFGQQATADDKLRKLEALLSRHGFDLLEAVPLFAPLLSIPLGKRYKPVDVSPQKQKDLTQDAVLALFFEMADKEPLILFVEDLQWADPTTLGLLTKLVSDASSAKLLALFSARPEFSPPWSTSATTQIHLGRLDRRHIEAMTKQLTAGKALAEAALEQVVSRTDGVPLFIEELLRAMVESGALVLRGDRYEIGGAPNDLSIPATLRDSLMARIDRLGEAKETAQIAAALGREFSFDVLAAVRGEREAPLLEDLDKLTSAEIIYRKRRLKGATYFFKHALMRDTAYESLSKRTQQKVHARIAQTLEERFPDVVRSRPELLALHHAAAEQKRRAIHYAQQAAGAALQRSANAEAIGYARQALGWLSVAEDARERAEMELALNGVITPALMVTRGWADPEVKASVDRSYTLLGEIGDHSPYAAPTLWGLSLYYQVQGKNRPMARALAEQFLALAQKAKDTGGEAAAWTAVGTCAFYEGKIAEALSSCERTLELYDTKAHRNHSFLYGHDMKVSAHLMLCMARWYAGYPDKAREQAHAAMAWAEELNHPSSTGLTLLYLTLFHHERGDRAEVLRLSERLLELANRYGLPAYLGYASLLRGWALCDLSGAPALALLEAVGTEMALSFYRCSVATVEIALGQHDAAIARLDDALERAERAGEVFYVPALAHQKGIALLARNPDAHEAAEACFRRAVTAAAAHGTKMMELSASVSLCQLLRERGEREEARRLLRPIYGWFTEGHDTEKLVEARALLKELAD